MKLETFNYAAHNDAAAALRPCLDIPRWIDALLDGRPYADLGAVLSAARTAAAPFSEAEIDAALAHHPRIGERARGDGVAAKLSSTEQAGLGASTAELDAALRQGNLDYERTFGRVFLIRAAGRDRAKILAELRRRLANDNATEWHEIAAQLREIAALRLQAIFVEG